MCTSSCASLPLMVKRTLGSFPIGCKSEPLTARGVTSDLARLSRCSPSLRTNSGPAAQMSAPESGRMSILACPLLVVTWAVIVGAGTIRLHVAFESWMNGMPDVRSELVLGVFIMCLAPAAGLPWRQTRLKCPILPHLQHARLYAGQFFLPPSCCLLPHPMHGGEVRPGGFVLIAEMSAAPCMSERDFLAASNPRHFVIA